MIYDPYSRPFQEDPYPLYEHFRDAEPCAYNPDMEYFGHGHHVCIGKSLARLETRIALEEVAARFPRYEVDEAGVTRTYQAHVKGYVNLPIATGR